MSICKSSLPYKILQLDINSGLAKNLNQGVRYSLANHFEFIARMDADDVCIENRFELQYNFLNQHSTIDVVGGSIAIINELGKDQNQVIHYPKQHNECLSFFKKRDPVAHPAVMFRPTFFEKVGLYNSDYRKDQDTELWYRGFLNNCQFANLDDVVLRFRQTNDLFKRRSNFKKSVTFLKLRLKINKDLHYGFIANAYTVMYFLLMMMPGFIKKFIYKRFR